jgi:hypothetical protein
MDIIKLTYEPGFYFTYHKNLVNNAFLEYDTCINNIVKSNTTNIKTTIKHIHMQNSNTHNYITSVDKRNMMIKEYDGKSLYSIFFDDIIEEFEQTEQIEYDGNQLEFMCSSKKYYYHVIARR